MSDSPRIQWFPGHMAKTRRVIKQDLKLVDIVVELLDARVPMSSENPEINRLIGNKPRLILLNKSDLADPKISKQWVEYFKNTDDTAILVDAKSGKGINGVIPAIKSVLSDEIQRRNAKGMTGRMIRAMIVGIPNVGKSSLINRLAGGRSVKVEDRPGVTRGRQWVTLQNGVELLDTPGILWHKFDDKEVGEKLAFTGAVKDQILDVYTLTVRLLDILMIEYKDLVLQRYKLTTEDVDGLESFQILEKIGKKRGMLISGGEIDLERAAVAVLDEFRGGVIGKMSLDKP